MTMGTQIPIIVEKPLAACGCRKFQLDTMEDHLCTCTTHSGAKKAHDWTTLNGHLHYPNDIDKSLHETATDKIRKYRAGYNHNPPSSVSFMSDIVSTSGRLHSEFIRLLFLQAHRETRQGCGFTYYTQY
jgi:hypothetical protein